MLFYYKSSTNLSDPLLDPHRPILSVFQLSSCTVVMKANNATKLEGYENVQELQKTTSTEFYLNNDTQIVQGQQLSLSMSIESCTENDHVVIRGYATLSSYIKICLEHQSQMYSCNCSV